MPFKILFSGFPATSSRGFLGWSTMLVVKEKGLNLLFDTGSYNERLKLLEKLGEERLRPEDIQMVVMSHLHFDHAVNFDLFPRAELVVGRGEWEYANGEAGKTDPFIPHGIVPLLQESNRLRLVEEGDTLADNLAIRETPGHTPGSISLFMQYDRDYLAIGDAVKNAKEFVEGRPAMGASTPEWLRSRERIREEAKVIIPGHDRPFSADPQGVVRYEGTTGIEIYADVSPYGENRCIFSLTLDRDVV